MTTPSARSGPPRKCPVCGRPRVEAWHPFCSARCRDRDMLRWLGDGYAIPGRPTDPEEPQPPTPDDDA